ncbi:hypothetical protein KIPB_014144, partial [Kipferlia bialata]|eukprot:g14144.t1
MSSSAVSILCTATYICTVLTFLVPGLLLWTEHKGRGFSKRMGSKERAFKWFGNIQITLWCLTFALFIPLQVLFMTGAWPYVAVSALRMIIGAVLLLGGLFVSTLAYTKL